MFSVCSGRHLGVAGARCYLSSSTSGGGGGEVVYVPGYEKVKELQQSVFVPSINLIL